MGRKPAKVRGLQWREDREVWEARYDVNGKRVRKSFADRSEAIVWLEMARGLKHKEGLDSLPTSATQPLLTVAEKKARREEQVNSITLGDLCKQYLTHIQNPHNPERPKDQRNPPQRVAAIKAAFGDRPAASLKPYEIKDWLISLGLSAATLNRYKSTLSAIFTYAKEREQIASNPLREVPHFKVTDQLPRWMSEEEEDKLRRVIGKWIRQTPSERKVTRLLLREHLNEITVGSQTGMRKGNQYSLRWEDIDFKLRLITLPDTKSGTPHTVPMTDDVYEAVRDQRAIQEELRELRGDDYESSRMQLDGRVFVISENREWFESAKKDAKVKNLKWHQLSRHTAGSRLGASGANQKTIQEVLGHATIAMSAKYTHLNKGSVAEAMRVLNRKSGSATA
jgi:integrase